MIRDISDEIRTSFNLLVRDLGGPCATTGQALACCIMFCFQRALPFSLVHCLLWTLCGIISPLTDVYRQPLAGPLLGLTAWAVTSQVPVMEAIGMACAGALFTCSTAQSKPWVLQS